MVVLKDTETHTMTRTVKVLSIDGGGIRGIIPAMVLDHVESITGRPVAEMFDLIAGTSTGGILTLGLTAAGRGKRPKFSAADMVRFYEEDGPDIFSRSIWHRVRSVGSLAEEKYPAKALEAILRRKLGNARLKNALRDVLVTSYDIEARKPYFFKRRRARQTQRRDCFIREAARATSAAPTYFEPFKLKIEGSSDYRALVDGGVFANDPAMCAYVEARQVFRGAMDILMVSLGTGELTRRLPFEDACGWGLAQWVRPVLDIMFDGVGDVVHYQMKQLLSTKPGPSRRYFRFQTKLTEGNDDMDDAGRTNIRVLKLLAEDLIERQANELQALCKLLEKE